MTSASFGARSYSPPLARFLASASAFLLAALMPLSAHSQEWTEIVRGKRGDIYSVDLSSISAEGTYTRAWVRTDIKEPEREADGWLSARVETLWVLDCDDRRYARKHVYEYNAAGRSRSERYSAPYDFKEVKDGTVGMRLANRVCEGRTKSQSAASVAGEPKVVKFAEDDDEAWNYAPNSLKFTGGRFEVVAFQTFAKPERDPESGKSVGHIGYRLEGDCSNSTLRTTQRRSFDSEMERIAELEITPKHRDFQRFEEKSVAFLLLKEVCGPKGYRVVAANKDSRRSSSGDDGKRSTASSGSGFAVSPSGHLLTNNHVVESCGRIYVSNQSQPRVRAEVLARDGRNDLALLKAPVSTLHYASFRATPIRPGDGIVALGYPLKGLLASEVNVATGTVSALAGLLNDTSKLQISAPIQPGNSGGPVLDLSGAVSSLAVEKLDALRIAKATGDVPSLVSFAIKSELATSFMRSSGIEPSIAPSNLPKLEAAEVASKGRPFTYLIECE